MYKKTLLFLPLISLLFFSCNDNEVVPQDELICTDWRLDKSETIIFKPTKNDTIYIDDTNLIKAKLYFRFSCLDGKEELNKLIIKDHTGSEDTKLWEIPSTDLLELNGGEDIYDIYDLRENFLTLHRVLIENGIKEKEETLYFSLEE